MKTPDWRKVKGHTGLYQAASGVYYSRYSLSGKPRWKTLETTVLTVATLRHTERAAEVERDRQREASAMDEFQKLGKLAVEFTRLVEASNRSASTKIGYANHLKRIRAYWRRGDFDTFPVRAVTQDLVIELRNYMRSDAKVVAGVVGRSKVSHIGFSHTVINDTLWVLRKLIDIAIEKRVLVENCFARGSVLRGKIQLPKQPKKPQLPSRVDLERVFVEMRNVKRVIDSDAWVAAKQAHANAAADFAEFLAYSGARHEEANAVLVQHDMGAEIHIPGFKSVSSDRTISVIPPLRRLLDRIRAGRTEGKLLRTRSALKALRRACSRLELPPITQHHLRHYFATYCVEKRVDIPTVSRWLGHADGGALAMRTYGHLRRDHSLAMAALVDDTPAGENLLPFTPTGSAAVSKPA